MDGNLAAIVAALVGLVTGAAAVFAFRASERERATEPAIERPDPAVLPEVAQVLSALPASVVLLDAEDHVVRASPAAYAFGIVRADRLVPSALHEMVRGVRRDGQIRQAELDLARGRLGSSRSVHAISVHARVAPLVSDGLVLLLVEDRTEARRMATVRRDFVANVSHELKTPVGALALLAEAVADAADDPEAVRAFSARLEKEARRLSHLVQDLIDLSRIESADPLAEASTVSLDDVADEAVDRSRMSAEARNIRLVTGERQGLKVYGDQGQLVTAVRNLVDNAITYSHEDTQVAVAVRRDDDLAEISVTDEGFGIAAVDLDRIFERFYRVDPARSRATGGTGLGLAIVKHIVSAHGGEVSVWSAEGSGSTFTIRLPVDAAGPAHRSEDVP
ncbi:MAG: sensor histidine kinase [Actinomycetes bacterium]